jgi:hypothetical protein
MDISTIKLYIEDLKSIFWKIIIIAFASIITGGAFSLPELGKFPHYMIFVVTISLRIISFFAIDGEIEFRYIKLSHGDDLSSCIHARNEIGIKILAACFGVSVMISYIFLTQELINNLRDELIFLENAG